MNTENKYPCVPLEEIEKEYAGFVEQLSTLKEKVLSAIRTQLHTFGTRDNTVQVTDLQYRGYIDSPGKYFTPCCEPQNYILRSFSLDGNGKLEVYGEGVNDDSDTYAFDENELDVPELIEILDILIVVANGLNEGEILLASDGEASFPGMSDVTDD